MTVKTRNITEKIDYNLPFETERKFLPFYPEQFSMMRNHEDTVAIEQVYLSSPDEPFNLRLREYSSASGDLLYEATLKDKGEVLDDGLRRLEVTTPITSELYDFYKSETTPILRKLRAEPVSKVVVDFYEDGSVQIESEDEEQWQAFISTYGNSFTEITGSPEGDNELRAHRARRLIQGDMDVDEDLPSLEVGRIINDILAARRVSFAPPVVHIAGRSGSGKSTVVRELVAGLDSFGISSSVLSTDDYHRGAAWLKQYNNGLSWQHWDDEIVYDIKLMAQELETLRSGLPIARREINWEMVEPVIGAAIDPSDVVIIEGIYATKHEITSPEDLVYTMTTPLATCVGRRLLRDLKERPQFADPAASLLYMLSDAEPAYRRQSESR